jgi:hypothetical protein
LVGPNQLLNLPQVFFLTGGVVIEANDLLIALK